MHDVKVRVGSVDISDRKHKIFHVEHHGGYKNIFQELVVLRSPRPASTSMTILPSLLNASAKKDLSTLLFFPKSTGTSILSFLPFPVSTV